MLEVFAQALLERETLDREAIEMLERGEMLPPLEVPEEEPLAASAAAAAPAPVPVPERSPPPLGLPGGEGPLPGAAPGVHADDEDEPLT
ncbi:MAG TPA: hypothetical protein EYQ27_07040 [Gemmatimonadetes bacterium]|nr:hypothetical protein [Gemmatimonadota bacterium]